MWFWIIIIIVLLFGISGSDTKDSGGAALIGAGLIFLLIMLLIGGC
jgi:hypothetical protein